MIDLRRIIKESHGAIDERDIAVLATAMEVGAVQSLFKVLDVQQKLLQARIRNKAELSDKFAEDVRYFVGCEKQVSEVMAIPGIAIELMKQSPK